MVDESLWLRDQLVLYIHRSCSWKLRNYSSTPTFFFNRGFAWDALLRAVYRRHTHREQEHAPNLAISSQPGGHAHMLTAVAKAREYSLPKTKIYKHTHTHT